MPTAGEIIAATKAMMQEDPIVVGMMTLHERYELAAAALRGAEREREERRTKQPAEFVDPDAEALRSLRGGPTVADPNRPYCKDDQSCCDFTCGN